MEGLRVKLAYCVHFTASVLSQRCAQERFPREGRIIENGTVLGWQGMKDEGWGGGGWGEGWGLQNQYADLSIGVNMAVLLTKSENLFVAGSVGQSSL